MRNSTRDGSGRGYAPGLNDPIPIRVIYSDGERMLALAAAPRLSQVALIGAAGLATYGLYRLLSRSAQPQLNPSPKRIPATRLSFDALTRIAETASAQPQPRPPISGFELLGAGEYRP